MNNEKIKALAGQAGFNYVGSYYDISTDENLKKFAELIEKKAIQDCRDMFMVGSVSWNLLNEKLELYGEE
jgi:hypothetical protein